jgi:hypothetical protein
LKCGVIATCCCREDAARRARAAAAARARTTVAFVRVVVVAVDFTVAVLAVDRAAVRVAVRFELEDFDEVADEVFEVVEAVAGFFAVTVSSALAGAWLPIKIDIAPATTTRTRTPLEKLRTSPRFLP